MLAPVALIGALALAGGGFDVSSRHIAGLAVWLVVVALLVFGAGSAVKPERPLYWAGGLIVCLSLLCALSSLWSGSIELSVIEADRVAVYLGFFIAAFLIAQTDERRQRFAEGLTIAAALVALLGLGGRLLPHVLDVSQSVGSGPRLSYPLGYWNANGAVFGIGIALMLWTSRRALSASLRWLSVALIPASLLALYFTYSRGGLLSLLVACGCLLVLSRDRLWLLATLAIGALGALPAVLAVQSRHSLADNLGGQAAIDQGVTVLLILLAGTALSLLLFAALRWEERREGRLSGRAVAISRNPRVLKGIALAAAVVVIAALAAVGGRAWHQFSSPDIQFPSNPQAHFADLSGAGRHEFYKVAIEAFGEKPILGHGAGTYQFSWNQLRTIELPVHDAHSLYLESFAELGIVGGLLVLALIGTLLWCAFATWRAAPEPQRDRYAALLAAMLAFAVGAAFDWFWEIPAIGAFFFLAAGVVVAARCNQLAADPRRRANPKADGRRFGLTVAAVVLAWVSAIALVGPLLVEHEIDSSQAAAAREDFGSAVDHAETARSIEPWAASPYVQLGLLAERQGNYPVAIVHFSHAIEREDRNWQWYYLRSRVEHEAGEAKAAQADLEKARELNPVAQCLRGEWTC
ncbi:MAG TPA: O-antigen ligase family protein [Solirubrobacterales bacterium]|nr:O-antigen ligase family protein [Solirubrobacterales bacterium]